MSGQADLPAVEFIIDRPIPHTTTCTPGNRVLLYHQFSGLIFCTACQAYVPATIRPRKENP